MSSTPVSWTKHTKGSAFSGIGPLEADILAIVWERDPQAVSVRDVYERLLQERRIAYERNLAALCRQRSGRFLSISSSDPIEWVLFDLLRRKGWIR